MAETAVLRLQSSRLAGQVRVSGAKNSVLRLLAASLLTSEAITLDNYPAGLLDAQVHVGMLEVLGKRCRIDEDSLLIEEAAAPPSELQWTGRSIRNTLLILGALVARTGAGRVPLPGGCDLGDRKYDLHELVLRSLGAEVWTEGHHLCAAAPNGLIGAEITLPLRSTGATENALLAGALARGKTIIWNPHIRPEIVDLCGFLAKMGSTVRVNGQESIEITGRAELSGVKHRVMPDNMEALTWAIGAVMTRGDVEILDFPVHHLEVPLAFLRESGAKLFRGEDGLIVRSDRPLPVEISTGPYPGINSDMQPLFAALGASARGTSRLVDLRFSDRYAYLNEFRRFGVESTVDSDKAVITGCPDLRGANVRALDLRAGAALTLLGLTATGETRVSDAWQILRGYEAFENKLRALQANVEICAD